MDVRPLKTEVLYVWTFQRQVLELPDDKICDVLMKLRAFRQIKLRGEITSELNQRH